MDRVINTISSLAESRQREEQLDPLLHSAPPIEQPENRVEKYNEESKQEDTFHGVYSLSLSRQGPGLWRLTVGMDSAAGGIKSTVLHKMPTGDELAALVIDLTKEVAHGANRLD
jgi:hypothetical protein